MIDQSGPSADPASLMEMGKYRRDVLRTDWGYVLGALIPFRGELRRGCLAVGPAEHARPRRGVPCPRPIQSGKAVVRQRDMNASSRACDITNRLTGQEHFRGFLAQS